jgi:DNA-binding CsgD family transcriptional regulator
MPKGSGRDPKQGGDVAPGLESAFHRIANLLALLLVKGESETEKVVSLTAAGFSPAEIGRLLDKRRNSVSALLYKAKKEQRSRDGRSGRGHS